MKYKKNQVSNGEVAESGENEGCILREKKITGQNETRWWSLKIEAYSVDTFVCWVRLAITIGIPIRSFARLWNERRNSRILFRSFAWPIADAAPSQQLLLIDRTTKFFDVRGYRSNVSFVPFRDFQWNAKQPSTRYRRLCV